MRFVLLAAGQGEIIGANIREASVWQTEAAGDDAELLEAQTFVEAPGRGICHDDGVELQDPEAQPGGLVDAVADQLTADAAAPGAGADGVAGIAEMAAAADVIGVQNIEPQELACLVAGDAAVALACKKGSAGLRRQVVFLGKCVARGDDFVPDGAQGGQIVLRIGAKGEGVHAAFLPLEKISRIMPGFYPINYSARREKCKPRASGRNSRRQSLTSFRDFCIISRKVQKIIRISAEAFHRGRYRKENCHDLYDGSTAYVSGSEGRIPWSGPHS